MIKNYKRIKVRGKYKDISYLAFYIHGNILDYVYDKIIVDINVPSSLAGALLIAESNLKYDYEKKFTKIWKNRSCGGTLQMIIGGYDIISTKKFVNKKVKEGINDILNILK